MNDTKPMVLSRWCTMFWHEGEWCADGRNSAVIWSPIVTTAPADARASVFGDRVSFYGPDGNGLIETVNIHTLSGCDGNLLYLGDRNAGAWYDVTGGYSVLYRAERGGWFVRWYGWRNTRAARAANAMTMAMRADAGPEMRPVEQLAAAISSPIEQQHVDALVEYERLGRQVCEHAHGEKFGIFGGGWARDRILQLIERLRSEVQP